MERKVTSLSELEKEAARFLQELRPEAGKATLVTLSGELGAGKTTFTQSVAQILGVTEHITSPTFVLEKVYELPPESPFKRLVHIDAYRLGSGDDLRPLRFDERMQEEGTLILLEWPERVSEALPKPTAAIALKVLDEDTRSISYED